MLDTYFKGALKGYRRNKIKVGVLVKGESGVNKYNVREGHTSWTREYLSEVVR